MSSKSSKIIPFVGVMVMMVVPADRRAVVSFHTAVCTFVSLLRDPSRGRASTSSVPQDDLRFTAVEV